MAKSPESVRYEKLQAEYIEKFGEAFPTEEAMLYDKELLDAIHNCVVSGHKFRDVSLPEGAMR